MQFDTWGNLTTSGTFTNTIRKRMDLSILADGTNDARALSISNITTYVNGTADYVHYQIGQNGNLVSFYLPPDTPDSTEIQICYYVAVPIVVQLTAGSMTILAGAKNVYSAGPIEVEAKYMTVVKEQEKLPETIRSSVFLQSGTISCNLQNGRRRQAQVTLVNLDNAYEFAVNHIWFGQQLRLSEGLILPDGTEYYIPQGIFEIETPQESLRPGQKTVTYSLVDKWANLDGTLFGNLEDVYSVAQGTNILSAIASVLLLDRFDMSNSGTHPIDPAKPILTNYYNDKTQTLTDGTVVSLIEAPYDFNSGSTGTAAEVILGLTEMVAGDVGYNQVGRLVLNPSQDDILDTDKPILWEFTQDSKTFLGVDYTTKAGDVYNDVIVVGATSDTNATARGRAQNLDPTSDTCVSRIGRKTIRLEMSNYYSDDICQDYAAWQLKRYSTVSKEVTVTCSQMFHIVENELITVQRSDKPGSPIERHVVQGFSRPIAQTGNMTINCISVNDYPIATIVPSDNE